MSADPGEHLIPAIVLSVVCLLLYAWFSAAESAFQHLNERQLGRLASTNRKAKKAVRHLEREPRLLSTLAWMLLLSCFLSGAFLSYSLTPILGHAFSFLPISPSLHRILALIAIAVGLAVVFLILGNLIPRKIAAAKPESAAVMASGFINLFAVLFRPVTFVCTAIANGFVRAIGLNPHASDTPATEEKILMMVDESGQSGSIEVSEQDMIANVFDFNDTNVREIMTHRTDLVAIEDTAFVQDVVNLALREGYSRIPVYHEDLDNLLGIVYVKDLLRYVGRSISQNLRVSAVMRPAFFVPDSLPASRLFHQMTERRIQAAILVDEYGGTRGMVTMEDILESIVGNIQDEYDHEEEEIRKINANTYLVSGTAPVEDVGKAVGVTLPEGDYDTIAGMVVAMLGNLVQEEAYPQVRVGPLLFTVEQVEEQRITHLLVEKDLPAPPENPQE